MLTKGYAVVIFNSNGMPRCVGVGTDITEAEKLIDNNITSKDLRAHVYPLPKTNDNIRVYKYKEGKSDRL